MNQGRYRRVAHLIPIAIIAPGIALRILVYLQNRNLWTDEVAVALNIFEKGFSGLTAPLDYNQYAPPLFLWMVKLSTNILGYSEQAFRFYPLLTGIGSLFVLHSILRKAVSKYASWYPLLVLATGTFYLRYATELKQYMPDAFIALMLVWLALRTDISKNIIKFTVTWILAGSMAIWSSMPSVFVLAAVGCYYGMQCLQQKDYRKLLPLAIIAGVWAAQFLVYYFSILQQQINSDYLINYHDRYFLFATPDNKAQWIHNKDVLNTILNHTFNNNGRTYWLNIILLAIGCIALITKRNAKGILFALPVLLMLAAAALNQYSLIPRLALFAMPLMLIIAGIGLDVIIKERMTAIKVIAILACLISVFYGQPFKAISQPIKEEQITESLDYLNRQGIEGKQLVVYIGAVNAYRYYTGVHPDKERYQGLQGAYLMKQPEVSTALIQSLPDTAALLYSIPFDSYHTLTVFREHYELTDTFETDGSTAYLFGR